VGYQCVYIYVMGGGLSFPMIPYGMGQYALICLVLDRLLCFSLHTSGKCELLYQSAKKVVAILTFVPSATAHYWSVCAF